MTSVRKARRIVKAMAVLLASVVTVLLIMRFAGGAVAEGLLSAVSLACVACTSGAVALDRRVAQDDRGASDSSSSTQEPTGTRSKEVPR